MKALVIGASGLVGGALMRTLRESVEDLVGTHCRRPTPGSLPLDITDSGADERLLAQVQQKITHILKPEGLLIVSTPDPSHPTWFREDVTHIQHCPMKDLAALLYLLGYREIQVWRVLDFTLPGAYPPLIRHLVGYVSFLARNIFSRLFGISLESRTFVILCRFYGQDRR